MSIVEAKSGAMLKDRSHVCCIFIVCLLCCIQANGQLQAFVSEGFLSKRSFLRYPR